MLELPSRVFTVGFVSLVAGTWATRSWAADVTAFGHLNINGYPAGGVKVVLTEPSGAFLGEAVSNKQTGAVLIEHLNVTGTTVHLSISDPHFAPVQRDLPVEQNSVTTEVALEPVVQVSAPQLIEAQTGALLLECAVLNPSDAPATFDGLLVAASLTAPPCATETPKMKFTVDSRIRVQRKVVVDGGVEVQATVAGTSDDGHDAEKLKFDVWFSRCSGGPARFFLTNEFSVAPHRSVDLRVSLPAKLKVYDSTSHTHPQSLELGRCQPGGACGDLQVGLLTGNGQVASASVDGQIQGTIR